MYRAIDPPDYPRSSHIARLYEQQEREADRIYDTQQRLVKLASDCLDDMYDDRCVDKAIEALDEALLYFEDKEIKEWRDKLLKARELYREFEKLAINVDEQITKSNWLKKHV